MSSFFRSLGSKKKSKSSLALSDGSDWGGNKTGGSWPASEERRLDTEAEADACPYADADTCSDTDACSDTCSDADADADAHRLESKEDEERRRQAAAAEERGERLERENNLLKLKVFLSRKVSGVNKEMKRYYFHLEI